MPYVLLLLALGAAGWLVWWEVLRDRQPSIEGEIDEEALAETPLCVRGAPPPCRSLDEAARLMQSPRLVIRGAEQTRGGNQGVIALLLETPDGRRVKAKWRPHGSASLFNTPAKELAAHRLETILIEPADYVIPPAHAHCFELEHYRAAVLRDAAPLAGTRCVFGFLSYWLTGARTLPEARRAGLWPMPPDGPNDDDPRLFDPQRFAEDAAYRRNIAVLNLVTHIVDNGDAHAGQFVLYDDPWHVFLIDSSLAFRAIPNPTTLFIQDLSRMLVPSIPVDVAARIAALERRDVEGLLALDEYAVVDGLLVEVEPGEPFDTRAHVRRAADRLQIGLTPADVRGVWSRIATLQRALAEGRLGTF